MLVLVRRPYLPSTPSIHRGVLRPSIGGPGPGSDDSRQPIELIVRGLEAVLDLLRPGGRLSRVVAISGSAHVCFHICCRFLERRLAHADHAPSSSCPSPRWYCSPPTSPPLSPSSTLPVHSNLSSFPQSRRASSCQQSPPHWTRPPSPHSTTSSRPALCQTPRPRASSSKRPPFDFCPSRGETQHMSDPWGA